MPPDAVEYTTAFQFSRMDYLLDIQSGKRLVCSAFRFCLAIRIIAGDES
jgi:hypothetical protein